MLKSKKRFISVLTLLILAFTSVVILAKPQNAPGQKGKYTSEEKKNLEKIGQQLKAENEDIEIFSVDNIETKKNIKFDTPPVIKGNRTLIPVRAISEGFKANVEWDGEEKKVIISKDDKIIIFELGSNEVFLNGEKVEIDTEAQAFSNRTYVPLRFIAEALGSKIDYNDETGKVELDDDLEESVEDLQESIEEMEESIEEMESILGEEDLEKLSVLKEKVTQLKAELESLDIDFSAYEDSDDEEDDDNDDDNDDSEEEVIEEDQSDDDEDDEVNSDDSIEE